MKLKVRISIIVVLLVVAVVATEKFLFFNEEKQGKLVEKYSLTSLSMLIGGKEDVFFDFHSNMFDIFSEILSARDRQIKGKYDGISKRDYERLILILDDYRVFTKMLCEEDRNSPDCKVYNKKVASLCFTEADYKKYGEKPKGKIQCYDYYDGDYTEELNSKRLDLDKIMDEKTKARDRIMSKFVLIDDQLKEVVKRICKNKPSLTQCKGYKNT